MTLTGPQSLNDLVGGTDAPWRHEFIQRDIGGGKVTASDLDRLVLPADVTALQISGLEQKALERLVRTCGTQLRGLALWKCPRLTDLTPLEDLPALTHVAIYWNQRTTRLWDLRKTPQLRGLKFEDFTRLHDLSDVQGAAGLEELEFGDAVWRTSVFATLDPLAELTGLRRVAMSPRRIEDGRIDALGALVNLDTLSFPSNLFTTEQVAWLRSRLPASVQAPFLAATRVFDRAAGDILESKDVLVIGRRKPFLHAKADAARIARYEREFEDMVAAFRADPQARPRPVS